MSRYVENMNRHVHSRHMVEQDMDWLKEFRWAVECYPPQRYVQNVANMRHLWILDNEPRFGWKQPTGHAPEPGHDNDDNEQPSHHGGIQQIIIGGES